MSKPMNLYVMMDVDLGDHFKVLRLANRLSEDVRKTSAGCHSDCPHVSVSEEEVIGYLFRVWSWTLRYDPEDGSLARLDEVELARVARYKGDPNTFAKALMEVEFITSDQQVHDWDNIYGPLNERRKNDRERKRKSRGSHADVSGISSVEDSREANSKVTDTDDPDV